MTNYYASTKLPKCLFNWLIPVVLLLLPLADSQAQGTVLTSSNPVRNAVAAPVAGKITLTFSRSLDPATTANVRVWGNRRQGLRPASRSGSNPLVLDLAQNFAPGEVVSVSVPRHRASRRWRGSGYRPYIPVYGRGGGRARRIRERAQRAGRRATPMADGG